MAERRGFAVKLTSARGLPDRLFVLPNGKSAFVEFKTPEGRVSRQQNLVFTRLEKIGHTVHIIRSVQAGRKLIDEAIL